MENSLVHLEVKPQRRWPGSQKWLRMGKPTIRSGKLRHTTKAKSTWGRGEGRCHRLARMTGWMDTAGLVQHGLTRQRAAGFDPGTPPHHLCFPWETDSLQSILQGHPSLHGAPAAGPAAGQPYPLPTLILSSWTLPVGCHQLARRQPPRAGRACVPGVCRVKPGASVAGTTDSVAGLLPAGLPHQSLIHQLSWGPVPGPRESAAALEQTTCFPVARGGGFQQSLVAPQRRVHGRGVRCMPLGSRGMPGSVAGGTVSWDPHGLTSLVERLACSSRLSTASVPMAG